MKEAEYQAMCIVGSHLCKQKGGGVCAQINVSINRIFLREYIRNDCFRGRGLQSLGL